MFQQADMAVSISWGTSIQVVWLGCCSMLVIGLCHITAPTISSVVAGCAKKELWRLAAPHVHGSRGIPLQANLYRSHHKDLVD